MHFGDPSENGAVPRVAVAPFRENGLRATMTYGGLSPYFGATSLRGVVLSEIDATPYDFCISVRPQFVSVSRIRLVSIRNLIVRLMRSVTH